MTKSLLNLSGKIDNSTVSIYETISTAASSLSIAFFVVGATARDMIFQLGYGIDTGRATVDVDLGVRVSNWKQFTKLKDELIATGVFAATKMVHRLTYGITLPVDIVPFGAIADGSGEIKWPPKFETKMTVFGFEEAFQHAQLVRLRDDPVLDIPFASTAGLTLMKLSAWRDRAPNSHKDALDLAFLMRHYLDAGNRERLAEEHSGWLLEDDFDYELSSARLLGIDVGKLVSGEAKVRVLDWLDNETGDEDGYPLVEAMTRRETTSQAFEGNLLLLEALQKGIKDIK